MNYETYASYKNTRLTLSKTLIKQPEKISDRMKKIILFLKDKIYKFSQLKTFLEKGGEYDYLIDINRPNLSFLDLNEDELFKLHLELLKIRQTNIIDYIKDKDKEWKKEFMPKINIIITGKRSCPSINELIEVIGQEEIELRIDKALAYVDCLMFPAGLGGVKYKIITNTP